MNTGLIQEFQATKVIKALKQMHPKEARDPEICPICFINIIAL